MITLKINKLAIAILLFYRIPNNFIKFGLFNLNHKFNEIFFS